MLLQDSYTIFGIVSLAEILGAIIATFFAIMTWWIIEKISKWLEWKGLVKAFNELYDILLIKKYEPNMSIDVVTLILEEIEVKNFVKFLKLQYMKDKGLHKFEGNDFMIEAVCGIAGNHLKLYQYGMPVFDYRRPEEGAETFDGFIEYYETQCRIAKIKLKRS